MELFTGCKRILSIPPSLRMAWYPSNSTANWYGLDIGGANLKIADGRGRARSKSFELWKHPELLADALSQLIQEFPSVPPDGFAITMTGELADCYVDKAHGVESIVGSMRKVAGSLPVRIAALDRRWLSCEQATHSPELVAAANWNVAARLVALNHPTGRGLWIDVGSTTIDAIPVAEGKVIAQGSTDTERLVAGELVYSGVRRTPVCALVNELPYRSTHCPVMAEWFATTGDVWLLADQLPEDHEAFATADHREFSRDASRARLARCIGADATNFDLRDAQLAASYVGKHQVNRAAEAIGKQPLDWIVVGGEGDFLAKRIAQQCFPSATLQAITGLMNAEAAESFPAHACAVLAAAELGSPTEIGR